MTPDRTAEIAAEIHALYEQRLTRTQIADRLDLPPAIVRHVLRGVPKVSRGPARGRTQTETVAVRFSPAELAEVRAAAGDLPLASVVRTLALAAVRTLAHELDSRESDLMAALNQATIRGEGWPRVRCDAARGSLVGTSRLGALVRWDDGRTTAVGWGDLRAEEEGARLGLAR